MYGASDMNLLNEFNFNTDVFGTMWPINFHIWPLCIVHCLILQVFMNLTFYIMSILKTVTVSSLPPQSLQCPASEFNTFSITAELMMF